MHFELTLAQEQLLLFKTAKLREISLKRRLDGIFELMFWLELNAEQAKASSSIDAKEATNALGANNEVRGFEENPIPQSLIPDYVSVEVAA